MRFPDCFHVSNRGQFAGLGLGAIVTHFLNRLLLRKLELCDFRLLPVLGFVQRLLTFNPWKLEVKTELTAAAFTCQVTRLARDSHISRLFSCFQQWPICRFRNLGATVTHFLNRLLLRKLELCDFRLLLVLGFVQRLPTCNPCKLEELNTVAEPEF
ncbi:hypothetical protein DVH24_042029 [Malus domestica]|uniref:Uncharacterized protein n=1 Tax=Malus domestica TaxID=3750 RepID=A0A498IV32_MALDO|nr:hypothetical protein DVH24_042029 [Malus domestica]